MFALAIDWLNSFASPHAAPKAASAVAGRLWASFGCGCSAVAAKPPSRTAAPSGAPHSPQWTRLQFDVLPLLDWEKPA